jgi:hypothetical protein
MPAAPPPQATNPYQFPLEISDEYERILVNVYRLLNRILGPNPLTPLERALVAGAKVVFDHLAKMCQLVLDREVTIDPHSICDPTETPKSTGPDKKLVAKKSSLKKPKAPTKPA